MATLPCNLSLMARFADINVSQRSVATYAICGRIFNVHLTANLPKNLPVKTILAHPVCDTVCCPSLKYRPSRYRSVNLNVSETD